MKRLKYGIVGAGFVGPHHIEAVRRLGFVEIAALASGDVLKQHLASAVVDSQEQGSRWVEVDYR
jgi:predicted dehydrogenase